MTNTEQFIRSTLQTAHGFLQRNQTAEAEKLVRDILKQVPDEPNSLHLLGLILKANNQFKAAINTLETAIKKSADKTAVRNSLGSTYYAQGEYSQALEVYETILNAHPNHGDALYNGALAATALSKNDIALTYARRGRTHYPDDGKFRYAEAQALGKSGHTDEAVKKYEQLLSLTPNDFRTLYALAVLLRENSRFEEAKKYILSATRAVPQSKEAWFILANIHYQLGEAGEADIAFRRLLTLDPSNAEVHQLLNNLYFEFDYKDKFAKSFTIGIEHAPTSIPMRLAQIDTLLQAERYDECASAIKKAEQDIGVQAVFKAREGTLHARSGDLFGAVEQLKKANTLAPDDPATAIALARYMIGTDQEANALDILDQAEKLAPFDQNLWALRGTAWHLMGDHRKADWLFGYNSLVKAREIHTPEGFDNLQEFLDQLRHTLERMHTAEHAPMSQTLRHGTQTIGQLLDHDDAIIQAYRQALTSTVHAFIQALPTDAAHPFLKRKTGDFQFSASWSVRLTKAGFHVSHIHPAGWLSSAFYVAFDSETVSDDPGKPDGWLHLGVPGIDLPGRNIQPARLIKPEPGLLALFPSYCWHGTNPIAHEGMRLTAPFDVIPQLM